jgi:hypothetical protein
MGKEIKSQGTKITFVGPSKVENFTAKSAKIFNFSHLLSLALPEGHRDGVPAHPAQFAGQVWR